MTLKLHAEPQGWWLVRCHRAGQMGHAKNSLLERQRLGQRSILSPGWWSDQVSHLKRESMGQGCGKGHTAGCPLVPSVGKAGGCRSRLCVPCRERIGGRGFNVRDGFCAGATCRPFIWLSGSREELRSCAYILGWTELVSGSLAGLCWSGSSC